MGSVLILNKNLNYLSPHHSPPLLTASLTSFTFHLRAYKIHHILPLDILIQ